MSVVPFKPAQQPDFPVTWVADAELKLDAPPVLKGLIEQGAFVVIYGPSGSGKSFFTADIAQHIAIGNTWRGRKCPPGLVVYVASEAGSSILKRFIGWRDNRLGDPFARIPLAVLTRGPNLLASVEIEKLCEQLSKLQAEAGLPLSLVIFDTLSRSIPGGDENKAEDMTMAVRAADILRDQFKAATAYVHHSGKDPDKGARGHSALFAAADLVLRVMDGCATVEKVRDGVAGERFPFTLEPIELGTDSDGDPVMTCLLNASDTVVMSKERQPTGRNQKIVLPALRDYAAEINQRSPGTSVTPKGALTFSMNGAIEKIMPKFGGDDPAFRVREKVKDAMLGLQATGFIGVHGDLVWLL